MLRLVAAAAAHPVAHHLHRGPFVPFWPVVIIGPLMFLIIVGLVVALIVRGRRSAPGPWRGGPWQAAGAPGAPPMPPTWSATPGPEQVLADRFARGEIDEAEYRARRDALRGQPGA